MVLATTRPAPTAMSPIKGADGEVDMKVEDRGARLAARRVGRLSAGGTQRERATCEMAQRDERCGAFANAVKQTQLSHSTCRLLVWRNAAHRRLKWLQSRALQCAATVTRTPPCPPLSALVASLPLSASCLLCVSPLSRCSELSRLEVDSRLQLRSATVHAAHCRWADTACNRSASVVVCQLTRGCVEEGGNSEREWSQERFLCDVRSASCLTPPSSPLHSSVNIHTSRCP